MSAKDSFEFLNSPLWLKYTHQNYRTLEEIRHRLNRNNPLSQKQWEDDKRAIILARKTNAVPLFLTTINKKFWFYPADCINRKADELEKKGMELHRKILSSASLKEEFLLDSRIEEAITSAIYEGANSTRAQAQELISSGTQPKNKDEWMIFNNFRAMNYISEHRDENTSLDLIKHLHSIVTYNTLEGDDANYSGKFRDDTVFVTSSRTREIKHEGLNFKLLESAVEEIVDLTTKNKRYFPVVIRGILLHYFMAWVHPFFDGNGRTARAMFYFKAMKNKLEFVELLSLSAYLKNHGLQYEKSFDKVTENDLDITYFIDFNLNALLKAITAVEKKVDYLLGLTPLSKIYNISETQVGLIQRLALNKFRKIDIEEYAKQINKSREVARQELKQLTDLNLVSEERVGKRFMYKINRDELNKNIPQK